MKHEPALPPTYLFTALASMVLLNFFAPIAIVAERPWNAAGLVPLSLGMMLNFSAGRTFIKYEIPIKAFELPGKLITSGVYRYSRNPMYLGMVLITAGAAILLGTLSPFIIVPLFALALQMLFIAPEEKMLAEHFGESWTEYRKKVRRWL